jgi:multidrug efflux system membrane fusion protein
MRLIPALTALIVSAVLYLAVFERERLIAFALGDAAAEAGEPAPETASATAAPDAPDEQVIGVVALHSEAREIDSAVVLRGETQALRQVEVRAETQARVVSEPLRKGQFVETGDVLCRLDPGTREAALDETRARLLEARARLPEAMARQSEARARVEEANARLEQATIDDNAAAKLSEGGFASESRVATARAAVRSAEAQIEAAKSGLETAKAGIEAARTGISAAAAAVAAAETEIDRLTIAAPFAGLLETDTAELGSLLQPGALCATVIQLDPVKLIGYVPEADVGRVETGAMAGARLAGGGEVQGRVTFVGRSADPQTRTFLVEIEVPNPDLAVRDGQTAEILIAADGAMAHRLPQSALTLNNEGRLGVRLVGDGDRVLFSPVRLLRDNVDGVWVAGLPDTADVIVVGQDFVTEGVKVAPTWRETQR